MRSLLLVIAALAGAAAVDVPVRDDDYDTTQQRTRLGTRTIPVPLRVQADLGLEPGQGMLVVMVRPGGTADHLGIRPGDVVTTIDGRPIASRADIRTAVRAAQAGDEVNVRVLPTTGDGGERVGTWQPRPPRTGPPPWAGMPPAWAMPGQPGGPWAGPGPAGWMEDERTVRSEQLAQLAAERRTVAQARRELDAARAAIGRAEPGWYVSIAITTP
jgi:hypothetical protein